MKKIIVTLLVIIIVLGLYNYSVGSSNSIVGYVTMPDMVLAAKPGTHSTTKEETVFIDVPYDHYSIQLFIKDSDVKLPHFTQNTTRDDGITSKSSLTYFKGNNQVSVKQRATYNGGYGRSLTLQSTQVHYKITKTIY